MKFTVYGEPKGKGRPRFTRNGRTYTPKDTAEYENLVRLSFEEANVTGEWLDGELEAVIDAYFAIPKSASKRRRAMMESGDVNPTKKPDCDNIGKTILDSLNGIAYPDDRQVVIMTVRKHYSDRPRVEVEIRKA